MKQIILFLFIAAVGMTSCSKTALDSVTPAATTTISTAATSLLLSPPPPVDSIPQSVRDYIAAHYPNYTIDSVETETHNGVITYEILIHNGTVVKELVFNASWVFLNEESVENHGGTGCGNGGGHDNHNDSHISIDSLPQAVKDSVARFFAGYTIQKADKETRNGVVSYEVTISNGTTTVTLIYDATGHLIGQRVAGHTGSGSGGNGGGNNIAISSIPTTATTYIATNYVGYTISKAEKEIKNGVTTYEVEIKMGSTEKTLVFDANWVFLRVK